jgi:hypothetical protein
MNEFAMTSLRLTMEKAGGKRDEKNGWNKRRRPDSRPPKLRLSITHQNLARQKIIANFVLDAVPDRL